jgi:hypothetical protein
MSVSVGVFASVANSACWPYHIHTSWNLIMGTLTKLCQETRRSGYRALYMVAWLRLYCCQQQYEMLCRSTIMQRVYIVAFPRRQSAVLYCWQLHAGQQQYRTNVLLHFHGDGCYANAPQWCVSVHCRSRLDYSVLWRGAAVIPYSQYWRNSYFTWNVKTRRLQERSMIRHRKWLLGQLSVSWIVLWSAFVTRFASAAYPPSHPDRTWDSVCGGRTHVVPCGTGTDEWTQPAVWEEPEYASASGLGSPLFESRYRGVLFLSQESPDWF